MSAYLNPAAQVALYTRAPIPGIKERLGAWTPSAPREYVSGPISGLPDGNRAAFAMASAELAFEGLPPVDPHVLGAHLPATPGWDDLTPDEQWQEYMRVDIAALSACDLVLMLPGWRRSRGAKVEYRTARGLGLPVRFLRPSWRDRISMWFWRTK